MQVLMYPTLDLLEGRVEDAIREWYQSAKVCRPAVDYGLRDRTE